MNWFDFCKRNWDNGFFTEENGKLKIYVFKGKIIADEYKQITGLDYVAA